MCKCNACRKRVCVFLRGRDFNLVFIFNDDVK